MYELVTKPGLRRTDNRFYYTFYSLSVARRARGGREGGSLPPSRAPALAFLSRLKLSFPSLPNACQAGYTFPRSLTHAADSLPAR